MIPEIVWDPPLETESGVENLEIDAAVVAAVLVVASVVALVGVTVVQSGQFQDSSSDSCFQVQGQFIEGLSIRLRMIILIELFFRQNIKCNWLA